jgi:hypothetical protein
VHVFRTGLGCLVVLLAVWEIRSWRKPEKPHPADPRDDGSNHPSGRPLGPVDVGD